MDEKPVYKFGIRSYVFNRILVISGCVLLIVLLMIAVPSYFLLKNKSFDEFPCKLDLSVPLSAEISDKGTVIDRGIVYSPGQYFYVNGTLRGCVCELKPCIRKCCEENKFYVRVPKRQATCQTAPYNVFENFTVPVYNSSWSLVDVSLDHFWILYGNPCIQGKYVLYPDERHILMDDGRISTGSEEEPVNLDASQYCMENVNGNEEITTFACFIANDSEEEHAMFTLYSTGMLISVPFMIVTVAVYGLVSELRNLHGKSLMSQTGSLSVAYICLAIVQIGRDDVSKFWCIFLAFTVQFTFLASFFWMNVMCFDIWWVFSGFRPPRGSAKERDHKKFLLYTVYAWGVPAVILAISLVMDLATFIPKDFIKPGFGVNKCWFSDKAGTLLYFYLPIMVIVIMNIAMFISTAFKLRSHTKETKVLHGSESRRSSKADKDRFNLYLKLFVVMGINWVLELVSFFGGGPKSLWFVTDIGNTLQGVLIFLIFVCKRRILRLVCQKLCPGRMWFGAASQSQSTHTTTTVVSKTASIKVSQSP